MKKVNFKKLKVEVEIDKFEELDIRESIGNTLHREAETIPMSELARRIYYSEGEIEIDEQLYKEMMNILSPRYKRFVIDAIGNQQEYEGSVQ